MPAYADSATRLALMVISWTAAWAWCRRARQHREYRLRAVCGPLHHVARFMAIYAIAAMTAQGMVVIPHVAAAAVTLAFMAMGTMKTAEWAHAHLAQRA